MTIRFILIIFFLLPNISYSQNPAIDAFYCKNPSLVGEYEFFGGGTYTAVEEIATDFIEVENGYILGITSASPVGSMKLNPTRGSTDFWIIRIDYTGNIIWEKSFGGSGYDSFSRIIKLNDGNILLGGVSYSEISGDKTEGSRGNGDFWLLKLDINGNKIWDKTLGSPNEDKISGLAELPDGSIMVGGSTWGTSLGFEKSSNGFGAYDYWIIKINNTGNYLFDKSYGGSDYDNLNSICLGHNNSVLLAGGSFSDSDGNKVTNKFGNNDYWVLNVDFNGDINWQNNYGGTNFDRAISVLKNNTFGYYIAGESFSLANSVKSMNPFGDRDFWVLKIDNQGNKVFDYLFGGSGEDWLVNMDINVFGDVFLSGWTRSGQTGNISESKLGLYNNPIIAKFDSSGNKLWDKRLSGKYLSNCWNTNGLTHLNSNGSFVSIGKSCLKAIIQIYDECQLVNQSQICQSEKIVLRAKNCNSEIQWNNGIIANQITVSPISSSTYSFNCGNNLISIDVEVLNNQLYVSGQNNSFQFRKAKNNIYSTETLNFNSSYYSGNSIELKPGFKVENNIFEAKIEKMCLADKY